MNIRKILPVFLLFLGVCIHATAYSQEINIQGYVHARGMSNHANIVVVFTSPTERYSATTDASGHYSIQIAIAKYVITCTRDGFFDHYENEIYLSSSQIYPEMTLITPLSLGGWKRSMETVTLPLWRPVLWAKIRLASLSTSRRSCRSFTA